MTTHSSILAWEIPQRSLAGYSPWGPTESNTTEHTYIHIWYREKKVKSLSRVRFFVTPWTVAYQAPPSMGARILGPWEFAGKNTRVGCHFLFQGIFPTQGLHPHLLHWQVDSFPLHHLGIVSLCERPALSLCVWSAWHIISTWKL